MRASRRRLDRASEYSSPSFSPDGSELAFVCDADGTPQVWICRLADRSFRRLTGEQQVEGVAWSPVGGWLAVSCSPGGGEPQVVLVRPDGTDRHVVRPASATRAVLGGWSGDGRCLLLSANLRDPRWLDPCCVDPTTGRTELVVAGDGFGHLSDLSRDGRLASTCMVRSPGWRVSLLVHRASGTVLPVLPEAGRTDIVGGGLFSPEGDRLYVPTNCGREFSVLAAVPIGEDGRPAGAVLVREHPGADLESIFASRDRRRALLSWSEAGRSRLELVHLENGRLEAAIDAPHEMLWGADFSPDGRLLALNLTGSTSPPGLWLFDLTTMDVVELAAPRVPRDDLVQPTLVRLRGGDGLLLHAWLYLPPEPTGACVLSLHGGPASQEGPSFKPVYQALVRRGVAILAPNVRGSTGFGKRFAHLDDREGRFGARQDVGACAEFAFENGIAAPGRLGIMGESYGGYLALCGMVDFPDLFTAGATISGITNLVTFLERTEPWMAAVHADEFGRLPGDRQLLLELSPTQKLDRLRAPLLVLHGSRDRIVPASEAEDLVRALRERGASVSLRLFPGEGHGFHHAAGAGAAAVERWFVRHLGLSRRHPRAGSRRAPGTDTVPYPASVTLIEKLELAAAAIPDEAAAVVDGVGEITFADLDRRSTAVAQGLRRHGLGHGHCVGVGALEEDWLDFLVACYGVYKSGSTLVPLSARLGTGELEQLLGTLSLEAIVVTSEAGASQLAAQPAAPILFPLVILEAPGEEVPLEVAARGDDIACVIFTAGTTGTPKAVACTHANLLALFGYPIEPSSERARCLTTVSIGTAAAQTVVHDTVGGPLWLLVPRFDAFRCCELIERHRVTNLSLVPSSAMALMDALRRRPCNVSSVRCVVSSSAPLSPATFDALAGAFPAARIVNTYSLAEGGTLFNCSDFGRPAALGHPGIYADVRIVSDAGADLPPHAVGEIHIRPRNAPPRRLLAGGSRDVSGAPDGWVATGDLGYVDEDGFVYFVDRKDDVIVTAGHNVSSTEVEAALLEHPAVLLAAAVGLPHPLLGQVVVAAVQPRSAVSSGELQRHCADRLAPHRRPHRIFVLDELPITPAGKVQKRVVRERLQRLSRAGAYVEGSDSLEGLVLATWTEVLGCGPVLPTDRFLELGGHSLLAGQVAVLLGDRLGREVPMKLLFEHPTARDLAAALRLELDEGRLRRTAPIPRVFDSEPARGTPD